MARNRETRKERAGKVLFKFKSSRGVGTRHEDPDGYVPSAGSPSLDELKRERRWPRKL